jgi:hypothetical protein
MHHVANFHGMAWCVQSAFRVSSGDNDISVSAGKDPARQVEGRIVGIVKNQ